MSRILDGVNDSLVHSAAVLSATPLTVAIWAKRSAIGGTEILAGLGVATTDDNAFRIDFTSSDLVRAVTRDASVTAASSGSTFHDTTGWHHVAGVWTSATNRQGFFDGVADTIGTGNRTPAGIDEFRIGARADGAQFFTGLVAHVAVWDVALSEAEVASLAGGANPLAVQADNLIAYYPLLVEDDFTDHAGAFDLTNVGSTHSTDNPTVDDPPEEGGGEATVSPAKATLTLVGQIASTNPFTNVRIRDVLVNEAGSPVGSRTGIHLIVWYAGVPSGAPDLSYSSMTSDANGTISWSIATGSLIYNQNIFYVAHDGNASGSLSQYTCARMIPNYE